MCVLPSMHVFATVAPSTCQIGEYVLSVVLTNFRADGGDAAEIDGTGVDGADVQVIDDGFSRCTEFICIGVTEDDE